MPDDTLSRFILLPDLKLTKAYPLGNWGIGIDVEKTSPFEVCPHCATQSSSVYDRRTIKVKDDPIRGKAVILKVTKRRFRCPNRRCRKVFTEPVGGIGKKARTTFRLKRAIAWACQHMNT